MKHKFKVGQLITGKVCNTYTYTNHAHICIVKGVWGDGSLDVSVIKGPHARAVSGVIFTVSPRGFVLIDENLFEGNV